jgi:phosphomannomutase
MKNKTTNYALEVALAAGATATKDQNRAKAKRICVGLDTALKSYQAARKIDNGSSR